MGLAPEPGVGKRLDAVDAAQVVLILRVKDDERRLAVNNVPFAIRAAFRRATGGIPFEAYWTGELTMQVDSVAALWWLAGRVDGDLTSTLDDALVEVQAAFTVDALSMDVETEESNHPEV